LFFPPRAGINVCERTIRASRSVFAATRYSC